MIGKRWRPGSTIRIHFLGGDKSVQEKVKKYAMVWTEHANINFDFVNDVKADVRIGLVRGLGHWSNLGTDALEVSKGATMNLGLSSTSLEKEYQRVVPHEFGHMLGCVHEHKSPSAGIKWNEEAVYDYYKRYHWGRSQVDRQVLNAYKRSQANSSKFDPDSIMIYSIPAGLTKNGFSVDWNYSLSKTDKEFISAAYPKQFHEVQLESLKCISTAHKGEKDTIVLSIYGEEVASPKIIVGSQDSKSLKEIGPIIFDAKGRVRIGLKRNDNGSKVEIGEFSIGRKEEGIRVLKIKKDNAVYELSYKVLKG